MEKKTSGMSKAVCVFFKIIIYFVIFPDKDDEEE